MKTWQGGAGGDGGERWGVLSFSFSFKLSKLEGTSSQDRSLSPFPNLKFSLYVIFRVLSVLEEGSHDPKVLAF